MSESKETEVSPEELPQIVIIPEDIAALTYEEARDELATIVARLEVGGAELEDALALWERGEVLAVHCQRGLDAAVDRTITTHED